MDDLKEETLTGAPWPAIYIPYNQTSWAWPAVLVRTSQNPELLLPQLARSIHGTDPFISVFQQQTMTERISQSPSAYLHRSAAVLVGLFAGIAFILSLVGLYGVIAYLVSQRTREIGVRMALGAEPSAVYRLILGGAGRLVSIGAVSGLTCSLFAAAFTRSLLFGIRRWDTPTFVLVALVLASAALVASFIPARRAATVNPIEALRAE